MRKYFFSYLLLINLSQIAYSQITINAINIRQIPYQIELKDTLLVLPFFDDFAKRDGTDSLRWKIFKDVSISNTYAENAPSIYQVTFDGTTSAGNPYQTQGGLTNGLGDVLESQPINLASLSEEQRQSLFLSFFWQLKGLGELPDPSDSLELQFFSLDSVWISQDISPNDREHLSLTGGVDNIYLSPDGLTRFRQVIVKIENPFFFHKGFRFRFRSFSSISGIYDTWHLDYIYLNHSRHSQDTLFFDRTISGQQGSLLFPYSQMPLEQYLIEPTKYSREVEISFTNLDDAPHPLQFIHTLYWNDSTSKGNPQTVTKLAPQSLAPLEYNRKESGLSISAITDWPNSDSIVIFSEFIFDTGDKRLFEEISPSGDTLFLPIDLRQNDTLRQTSIFHQVLAYDDGSAEFAAGINQLGSQLGVAFFLEQPDTLTDIDVYFPEVVPSPLGRAIEVYVYQRLTDEIPLRSVSYTVSSSGINEFQRVSLVNPIIVRDTFYIAYQQFTNDYLGIGLDKNYKGGSSAIFYNTKGFWEQNTRLSGSLMIRAVFQPGFEVPPLTIKRNESYFHIYPNPTSDYINIQATGLLTISIINLSGKSVLESTSTRTLNISDLESGLYFIFLKTEFGNYSQKLIKKDE